MSSSHVLAALAPGPMPLALLARDLLLLRRGPQDAPYAPRLMLALIALTLAVDAALAMSMPSAVGIDARVMLTASSASLFGLLATSALILQLAGRPARFVQTATALLLVELTLAIASLPLTALVGQTPAAGQPMTSTQALATLGFLAIGMWGLVARGHVLRHALEVGFARGVLLALVVTLVEGVLVISVLGRNSTQAGGI